MRSYGGQAGTNALYDLNYNHKGHSAGNAAQLVYLSAFVLSEGGSMVSKVQESGHEHLPLVFEFAEDNSCTNRDPKTLLVGPGVDEAWAEKHVSSLGRWNGRSMYQAVTHCAWRDIPVTYIYTSHDKTVPSDYQKSTVERMQAEGHIVHEVELASSHCSRLTMTQDMATVIIRVAEVHVSQRRRVA